MNDCKKIVYYIFVLSMLMQPETLLCDMKIFRDKKSVRSKNIILSSVNDGETNQIDTNITLPEPSEIQQSQMNVVQPRLLVSSPSRSAELAPTSKSEPLAQKNNLSLISPSQAGVDATAPLLAEIEKEKTEPLKPAISIEQLRALEEEEDTVEMNFENASLEQLVQYISEIFQYTFLTPDMLEPIPTGEKKLKGNLISFKTHEPLSKKEAWALFLTFLDMAGFNVVPDPIPNTFRIMSSEPAKRAPLPTFIGIAAQSIPPTIANTDQMIRYVYFIENSTVDALKPLIDQIKSPLSDVIGLKEHNALLIIDRAYNIVNLMQIIKELDKVSMPQAMSVLKLRRADAEDVKKLYDSLIKTEEPGMGPGRLFQRKQPTSVYFPENIKILTEPRTNSLIILGPLDAIKKIEDFVIQYVDVELDRPFSPLYVYQLQYAGAETIAKIMNEVTAFGATKPELRATGGIRGVDKYFKPMQFTPEPQTNRIVIKGDYEDYIASLEIIKQLDVPQPQVAIEALILAIDVNELKILGTQMRTRVPCGLLGDQVAYQTSGSFTGVGNTQQGIVRSTAATTTTPGAPGVQQLLGNLINLVTATSAGNTLVSLGDSLGVWALIQALQTLSSTQVVANPFLLATNKTEASVVVGITQRVVASQVLQTGSPAQNTFKDESANLELKVTPQINSDGMIILDIKVTLDNFIGVFDPNFVRKQTREVVTKTTVANNEVIALGGLIQNTTQNQESKVPILGDIPIIGWLFKNRSKNQNDTDLLILITPQIIEPIPQYGLNEFTRRHVNIYEGQLGALENAATRRDPIHRFFFEDKARDADQLLDDFIFERHKEKRIAVNKHQQRRRRRELDTQANQNTLNNVPAKVGATA